MIGISVLVEEQIMRAGLAGDIDPARLCLAQGAQLIRRGDMQNVNARARPLRKNGGAGHRLDGDNGGARGRCARGSFRPAACSLFSRQAMMEAVSA